MAEPSRSKARRRWFGGICLSLAILMLVAGETVLKPHLRGVGLLGYWLGCLVLTALAAGAALLDAARIGWQGREERRTLLEDTLREVERERESRQKKR
jgi:hypothetical protein